MKTDKSKRNKIPFILNSHFAQIIIISSKDQIAGYRQIMVYYQIAAIWLYVYRVQKNKHTSSLARPFSILKQNSLITFSTVLLTFPICQFLNWFITFIKFQVEVYCTYLNTTQWP